MDRSTKFIRWIHEFFHPRNFNLDAASTYDSWASQLVRDLTKHLQPLLLALSYSHHMCGHVAPGVRKHMVLLKYFHPVRSEPKLKEACGTSSVSSSNGQSETTRKRGTYSKFTPQDEALIGKYTSEHGVMKAVWYFKGKILRIAVYEIGKGPTNSTF